MPSIEQLERKRPPPTLSEGASSQLGKAGKKSADAKAAAAPSAHAQTENKDEGEDKDEKNEKEEGPARRRKTRAAARTAEVEEIIKVLPSLARLTLQNTQRLRANDAVMLDTWLLMTVTTIVGRMRENTQKYSTLVTDIKKQKGDLSVLGPPHIVAFEGLLAGAIEQINQKVTATAAASNGAEAAILTSLQKLLQEWQNSEQAEANEIVPYCRASATYKPETTKIQLHIRDPAARKTINEALARCGAQRKIGQAAPGALERMLQRAVD